MISIPGYEILNVVGQGGMATVYQAIQKSTQRNVAIKVMSNHLAADPSFSERFLTEARMANLTHPHIVTVYDAGEADGQNYIVMQYAGNGNFEQHIKQGILIEKIIEYVKQIASALGYAAKKGVIHRDVKSENILINNEDQALLVDFGIAKAVSRNSNVTSVGTSIGSPNYMSPEQARGDTLDNRSDLYSLGMVFFHALTNKKPYDAADTYVIALKQVYDPIPQLPTSLNIFQDIIDILLAKNREHRFANAEEFVDALEELEENIKKHNPDVLKVKNIDISESNSNLANTVQFSTEFVSQQNEKNSESFDRNTDVISFGENVETLQFSNSSTTVNNELPQRLEEIENTLSENRKDVINTEENESKYNIEKQDIKTRKSLRSIILSISIMIFFGVAGYLYILINSEQAVSPDIVDNDNFIHNDSDENIGPPKDQNSRKNDNEIDQHFVTEVEKNTIEVEAQQDKKINELLKKARLHVQSKRLTTPAGNNALESYKMILSMDENNQAAMSGIDEIVGTYVSLANKQMKNKKVETALSLIKKGLNIKNDNIALLNLQETINAAILEKTKQKKVVTKTVERRVLPFKFNDQLFSINSIVKHKSKTIARKLAKQGLHGRVYNLLLQQCSQIVGYSENNQCEKFYENYLLGTGLALTPDFFKEVTRQGQLIEIELSFDELALKSRFPKLVHKYESNIIESNRLNKNKDSIMEMLNYQSLIPLMSLFEQPILSDIDNRLKNAWVNSEVNLTSISNELELPARVKKELAIIDHVGLITAYGSNEVTPFSAHVQEVLQNGLGAEEQNLLMNDNVLSGKYFVLNNGEVLLDLWVSSESDIVQIAKRFRLSHNFAALKRKSSLVNVVDLIPQEPLYQGFNLPLDILFSNRNYSAALRVGKTEEFQVRFQNPGFYYLAVHVVRSDDQFSYLQPIRRSDLPFVEVITSDQKSKTITIGKFRTEPPLGTEVIQLIGSDINLEKYLPDFYWDDKKENFIIKGSEGDIKAGLNLVRSKLNNIKNAFNKNAHWQEKLMVTSIVN